jgi:hypothetical protein
MRSPRHLACNLPLLRTAAMSYLNRRGTRKRAGSAELIYLIVVVAAGFATAWWAGHKVGMDLSSITAVASVLGLTDTGRLTHGATGYQPAADAQPAHSSTVGGTGR